LRIDALILPSDELGPEFSIFVGDLGPEVNDFLLVSLFQNRFQSCKTPKAPGNTHSSLSPGLHPLALVDP
jgi:hypothetical protein